MANSVLVAASGEHYVAFKVAQLGYNVAMVRQGSSGIDLLASNVSGSRSVAIQVKATSEAERLTGRGAARKITRLEFPLGHAVIEKAAPPIVCFVDLYTDIQAPVPRVYVVPIAFLVTHFEGEIIRDYRYFRLHISVELMEQFKEQWLPLHALLADGS